MYTHWSQEKGQMSVGLDKVFSTFYLLFLDSFFARPNIKKKVIYTWYWNQKLRWFLKTLLSY